MDSKVISEYEFWFAMGVGGTLHYSFRLLSLRGDNMELSWEEFYKTYIQPITI
jgi:hypothetical protein